MKDYTITINHTLYENTLTFKSDEDAAHFAAKRRLELAHKGSGNWMEYWFQIFTEFELEEQLREKIAQEILSHHLDINGAHWQYQQCKNNECVHIWDANIVRGKK